MVFGLWPVSNDDAKGIGTAFPPSSHATSLKLVTGRPRVMMKDTAEFFFCDKLNICQMCDLSVTHHIVTLSHCRTRKSKNTPYFQITLNFQNPF
jgi:hypothetical protein